MRYFFGADNRLRRGTHLKKENLAAVSMQMNVWICLALTISHHISSSHQYQIAL